MVSLDFSGIQLKLRQQEDRTQVWDPVRKKWIILTPEEHVRQYLLQYLHQGMGYPLSLMAVEKKLMVGKMAKRFDIVVYDRDHRPWMLVECKEPQVHITQAALYQLLNYHSSLPCRFWLLTNGHETHCAMVESPQQISWLDGLPLYNG